MKADIRIYENKLLFDNFNKVKISVDKRANSVNEDEFNDDFNNMSDIDDLEILNPKLPEDKKTYSITVKNSDSRPKSSSYIDWRGQISKPPSPNKISR